MVRAKGRIIKYTSFSKYVIFKILRPDASLINNPRRDWRTRRHFFADVIWYEQTGNSNLGGFRKKIKVLFLDRLKCQELKTSGNLSSGCRDCLETLKG